MRANGHEKRNQAGDQHALMEAGRAAEPAAGGGPRLRADQTEAGRSAAPSAVPFAFFAAICVHLR
jgi:hypothetical protein